MDKYIIDSNFLSVDTKRLDQFLSKTLRTRNNNESISRTQVKKLIETEKVRRIDQKKPLIISDPNYKVCGNEIFEILIPISTSDNLPVSNPIDLEIIFEDNDLLVVNKKAGMVVHPGPGHRDLTLVNALISHCGESLSGINGIKRPGIVHRLDKDTSGLMVIAKNDNAHHYLSSQFINKTLTRGYKALVWGQPLQKCMRIETFIDRCTHNRQKMCATETKGKKAITNLKVVQTWPINTRKTNSISLVECWLETGRTHQIRVHCEKIKCFIIGDQTYGLKNKSFPAYVPEVIKQIKRQALHAFKLIFKHPRSNETLTFESPLPTDILDIVDILKKEQYITMYNKNKTK